MVKKAYTGAWCKWMSGGAGCPVNLPLLNKFCNIYFDRLERYGDLLRTVTLYEADRCSPDERRSRERKLDRLITVMTAPASPALHKFEEEAVWWFLAELRAEWNGKPVRCKDFIDTSAHELAFRVMRRAAWYWRLERRICRRRQRPAWEDFHKYHTKRLPSDEELEVLMKLEYALARKVLLKEQRERQASNG